MEDYKIEEVELKIPIVVVKYEGGCNAWIKAQPGVIVTGASADECMDKIMRMYFGNKTLNQRSGTIKKNAQSVILEIIKQFNRPVKFKDVLSQALLSGLSEVSSRNALTNLRKRNAITGTTKKGYNGIYWHTVS